MLGKTIGNYQITGELAQGGMGAVYRGRHQKLPREVVVKSILLSSFPPHAQEQLKARFVREAYVQSQLDHQNVVRVYEFFTTVENYYLVMEFIDGMNLRDLITRQGGLAPSNAVPLFKQALSALDYAHNFNYVDESGNRHAGIIHRDIKPANMLLDGMARLKITDFGIVKLAGESNLTRTGFNPGTVAYMSPEQIRGVEVDARSDIYSLGVTFYETLTGRLPFPPSDTGSEYEMLRGHIELAPPPLATVKPGLPEALSAIVMRSLEKDPNARFQSVGEFLDAMIRSEQSGPTAITSAATKPPQATHSMTDLISYDTRQAPVTSPVSPPRSIQPHIPTQAVPPQPVHPQPVPTQPIHAQPASPQPVHAQTVPPQVVERAPVNHPLETPSRQQPPRIGLMIAVALIILLAGGGAAFMFLRQSGAPISAATDTPTLAPTVTPTPAATQEDPRVKRAREAESQERYSDAIILYGEYLVEHALDTDPGVKEIQNHKSKLEEFYGLINLAQFEMNKQDYVEARRDYAKALELRPDSKLAKDGLAKAESRSRGAR